VAKYAVIINGDREGRHLQNVERAGAELAKSGFSLYVASPQKPELPTDQYVPANKRDVAGLLESLRGRMGPDDELVIYTTGHGAESGMCLEDGCNTENIVAELDHLPYSKRVVVMDQCFGGNFTGRFVDDPRTLFVSAGSKDETVCCGEFAPRFWAADVPDLNGDGVVSFAERHANVMAQGVWQSVPRFVPTEGYIQDGAAPFENKVIVVEDEGSLNEQLKRLKPGQYAIMTFSTTWCGPCRTYKPIFDEFAEDGNGQHLWLRTESEDLASAWGITGYPTIMIIDGQGNRHEVDRNNVLSEISEVGTSLADRARLLRKKFSDADPAIRANAVYGYGRLADKLSPEELAEGAKALRAMFADSEPEVLRVVASAYGELAKKFLPKEKTEAEKALRAMFTDSDSGVRFTAAMAYCSLLLLEKTETCVKALKMMFANDVAEVRMAAVIAYGQLADANKLSPEELAEGARVLRTMFEDGLPGVRSVAVSSYDNFTNNLSPEELAESAKALRAMFADSEPQVRRLAVFAYHYITPKLSSEEAMEGAKALRVMFADSEPEVKKIAVSVYYDIAIAYNLSPEELAEGAKALRTIFADSEPEVRRLAVSLYHRIAHELSPEELAEGAKALRVMFADSEPEVRKIAVSVYYNIAIAYNLSPEELAEGAKALRVMFADSDPEVRKIAVSVYHYITPKLSPEELAEGAKALRAMFADSDREVQLNAILAYGRIKGMEVLKTMFASGGDLEEFAKRSFCRLIKDLSSEEVKKYAKDIIAMLTDSNPEVRWAAISACVGKKFASTISTEVVNEVAGIFRTLFADRDQTVRRDAVYSYGRFAKKSNWRFSREEMARGSSALRVMFADADPEIRERSTYSYVELAHNLSPEELAEGAKALRAMFADSDATVRLRAVTAYVELAHHFSPEELAEGAKALRAMFADSEPQIYDAAMKACIKLQLSGKLPPGEELENVREF
jgi:thiol-disulfide isomerase/thioredoxin/alkanesulfonate monooxygenase SsuD/methylene tetrahydromethanopterin reductase-like flavin-dependent oxidoreductase (luciferase family)